MKKEEALMLTDKNIKKAVMKFFPKGMKLIGKCKDCRYFVPHCKMPCQKTIKVPFNRKLKEYGYILYKTFGCWYWKKKEKP